MTILSARGLTMHYDGAVAPALAGVDLDLAPSESVAIMGASGSGKTTLLHCLAGILRPTAGTVTLAGARGPVEVTALDDDGRARLRREELGFVFQQGLLLNELTALENVAVARMLAGVPRAQAEGEAAQWLAHLGLAGLEQRRLGELSGGQAQRVAIARAQVTGARLIFADEPTGALDSTTSGEVLDLLLSAVKAGRTLVVVTHDVDVARRCARTVTLHDGRVVSDSAAPVAPDAPVVAPEVGR
jgi:putative ABC transport system ATP-binding protein